MRGQIKREVAKEEFDKLLKGNTDLKRLDSGVYIRPENLAGGVWNRPIAAQIGEKFYVMRPA